MQKTIELTEAAAAYLQKRLEKQSAVGIRLGVVDSGCSGHAYQLDLATEIKPDDSVFEEKGITILVDEKSLHYLRGTQLDCVQEGLNESLKFINPNVVGSCGCGESFSVSK